ncbi:MAG: leucyl aminopeptidase [Chloroflexi bacterium CG07_land_8_20_14_0_80_45_17]|nr:MAG: leucyl aminopeptidase [Chloroflexi bacterium CG07_land_8_20_14_0_80_45_17]
MEVKVIAGDITQIEADAIVVNLFEGVGQSGGATAAVDKALDGGITQLISNGEIRGKFGEVGIIHTLGKLPAGIVAVAGLGKRQDFTLDRIRGVAGEFCRSLRKLNCHRIATILHDAGVGGIEPEASVEAIVEGSLLGLYSFTRYKKPEYEDIKEILVVEREESKLPALERGVQKGKVMAEATALARDMVNEPANCMTPSRMSEVAKEIADEHNLEFNVLDSNDMEAMGMGALLGVAKGSSQAPKLITLSYKGDVSSKNAIGFIGKGVTFDSGGISVKPSEGMGEMKNDMAGGAAVMAALSAIAQLKPKINVAGIVPATENLPSGSALKPGDVLKAMNGKTIEVISTDAEGRLILADALSYAVKQGFSPLVDMATLTGACRVALGTGYSGVFGNDQELVDKVLKAGSEAGEKLWQMPMPEEYKEQNKSEIADIKNIGDKYGGAITAALFLGEFVDNTPWVHLDIAGTASSSKESGCIVKGATGVGVGTLVELALSLAK